MALGTLATRMHSCEKDAQLRLGTASSVLGVQAVQCYAESGGVLHTQVCPEVVVDVWFIQSWDQDMVGRMGHCPLPLRSGWYE